MHGKKIISNSIIGVIYKIAMILLGFITRKLFIVYLGEELLGLNSLYSNLLDLLNLAELGLGVAVQYQLYEPLVNKDIDKQARILSVAKKIYNRIGIFIVITGIVLSIFIQYLIKETTYPVWYIRTAFLISVLGVASGYFFVHLRLYMQANEEIGLVNIFDLIAKLITVLFSIVSLVIFRQYFIYLFINVFYGILSNIFVYIYFKRKNSNIVANRKDLEEDTKRLTSNLKDVLPLKLTNYVYNSTDNIIISKILGLTTVALYSNYMLIINGIMNVEYLVGNVVMSSLGKIIHEEQSKDRVYKYYLLFQYIQYWFTSLCTTMVAVICTQFITFWVGKRFIICTLGFVLLVLDFFVHSMYQPAYVMFGATGQFKGDKYITAVSAVMNIVLSVIMVYIVGLPGVIIGTLLTDIYIWIVRSYQVVKRYFKQNCISYLFKMIKYCLLAVTGVIVSYKLSGMVYIGNILIEIIVKALICFVMSTVINVVGTIKSTELKTLIKMMHRSNK